MLPLIDIPGIDEETQEPEVAQWINLTAKTDQPDSKAQTISISSCWLFTNKELGFTNKE